MQTRHRIALATAGLLAGVQIGAASIGIPMVDPGEQMEPTPREVSASADGIPEESTDAQNQATTALGEPRYEMVTVAQSPAPTVAPPRTELQSTPFPPSADDLTMLPALAAYLARTEHLRVTGASNVFPPSADELPMLPAMVAYFERHDANRRLARAQRQVVGEAPAADITAASQPLPEARGTLESTKELSAIDSADRKTPRNPL